VATIEDVSRIIHLAAQTAKVVRVTLHPDDFRMVASSAPFASITHDLSDLSDGACRGHLWGVAVHVDSRSEKGVAYVVTRDAESPPTRRLDPRGTAYGTAYPLEGFIKVPRRTAWARVLEDDDDLGVDTKSESQDGDGDPRSLQVRTG